MDDISGPGLKKFFIKILNSIGWVLLWAMSCVTAGIYFQLGVINGKPLAYAIMFYVVMLTTLALLIRHLYKTWKNG